MSNQYESLKKKIMPNPFDSFAIHEGSVGGVRINCNKLKNLITGAAKWIEWQVDQVDSNYYNNYCYKDAYIPLNISINAKQIYGVLYFGTKFGENWCNADSNCNTKDFWVWQNVKINFDNYNIIKNVPFYNNGMVGIYQSRTDLYLSNGTIRFVSPTALNTCMYEIDQNGVCNHAIAHVSGHFKIRNVDVKMTNLISSEYERTHFISDYYEATDETQDPVFCFWFTNFEINWENSTNRSFIISARNDYRVIIPVNVYNGLANGFECGTEAIINQYEPTGTTGVLRNDYNASDDKDAIY